MNIVGDKLTDWALHARNHQEFEAFGRSAFSRYYYSTYWVVRRGISQIDGKWARQSHSGIPELLEGKIANKARRQIEINCKNGLFSRKEAGRLRDTLNAAISNLTNLLKAGYEARKTADYEIDQPVVKHPSFFEMNGHKIGSAKAWESHADRNLKILLRLWNEIGL